jgi:hypothetical protein
VSGIALTQRRWCMSGAAFLFEKIVKLGTHSYVLDLEVLDCCIWIMRVARLRHPCGYEVTAVSQCAPYIAVGYGTVVDGI